MDIGFETIGNATLIAHDRGPVLATDPWIAGAAYFGSWCAYHEIPAEQLEHIKACRFVWVSHGHPDHLSAKSLALLKGKKILLPDHVGGRILNSLKAQGHDAQALPDRRWMRLSDRIRVLCIADYNQDGILLVDIGGRLVVNLNDASDRGWAPFVKSVVRGYRVSFLMRLSGSGDADMANYFDETGKRLVLPATQKRPVGRDIARTAEEFGVRYFVPFSSMHKYQRSDSIWANEYSTKLGDYSNGFASKTCELLPAYIRYDCAADAVSRIDPPETAASIKEPKDCGDDWGQPLEAGDFEKIRRYFQAIKHLEDHFDFVTFRVGGKEHPVSLGRKNFKRGITFEAPRNSLMISIENEIFDDMLIGNFMKTTLHGDFPATGLYPDFTPYVAKYADNGRAKTREELDAYFAAYRRRAPLEYLRHRLEKRSIDVFRSFVPMDSGLYSAARALYRRLKG